MDTATGSHWLLTEPSLASVSGEYFVEHRKSRASATVYDASARARLWDYLVGVSGATWPKST